MNGIRYTIAINAQTASTYGRWCGLYETLSEAAKDLDPEGDMDIYWIQDNRLAGWAPSCWRRITKDALRRAGYLR